MRTSPPNKPLQRLGRRHAHLAETCLRDPVTIGWLPHSCRTAVAPRSLEAGSEDRPLTQGGCSLYRTAALVQSRAGQVGRVQAQILQGVACPTGVTASHSRARPSWSGHLRLCLTRVAVEQRRRSQGVRGAYDLNEHRETKSEKGVVQLAAERHLCRRLTHYSGGVDRWSRAGPQCPHD